MENKQLERTGRNTLAGALMGALLFLGGLFLTVWTWGFGVFLGGPMMLFGLALPFIEYKMAKDGKSWIGRRPGRPAVRRKHSAG